MLVKFILFSGVTLQFVFAFFFFIIFKVVIAPWGWNSNFELLFSMILGFLVAVPVGFLVANFAFHAIKPLREELDKVSDYKGTQILLFKLLLLTIVMSIFTLTLLWFLL